MQKNVLDEGGDASGLAGVIGDIGILQACLFKSGQKEGVKSTHGYVIKHVLKHMLVADIKTLKKGDILATIRGLPKGTIPSQSGYKLISIYYTGHGQCKTGDWCFNDGQVTL